MSNLKTSIYAYPWDLIDEGIDQAVAKIATLGVDALQVSMSYHSGKFISPRNPRRRVYFPIEHGFSNLGYYNYGMLPEHRLLWIKDAIRSLRGEGIR